MNDELSLAYLLNPTFELVNTNGKPLTDGYIEVYIAGSRDKYYCYSDFDGTLHPFKIPLDSLGSNIVLAELDKSYDIYIYNKYGSMIMSRYNVVPVGTGGSGSSIPNITISSNDETVQVENVSAGNFDLSISNTVDRVTALEEAIANIVSDSTAAYSIAHSNTTNNGTFNLTNDGVSGVEYLSDMTGWRLQSGHIYQMNFNAKLVSDVDRDRYINGKLYLEGIDTVAQEWQFTLDDSYDHTESVNGSTVLYIPSNLPYYDVRLKYDSLIAPTLNKISIVDITSLIEHEQVESHTYTGVSGVIVDNTNDLIMADMDYINSQLNVEAQIASGIQIANEYTDNVVNNVSGNLVEYVNNENEQIISTIENVSGTLQNEIDSIPEQVNADWLATSGVAEILNKPDLSIYATHTEVIDAVTSVSSIIPTDYVTHNEVSAVSGNLVNTISSVSSILENEIENIDLTEYATHSEVNIVSGVLENEIQNVSAAIPTDYVTHNEVSGVSGNIVNYVNNVSGNLVDIIETATGNIPEQVNADWNAVSGKAEILNKPDQIELIAGENIGLFENGSTLTISASAVVTSGFATKTELATVSGNLQQQIDNIPEQVNADWNAVSGVQEILNKPDQISLIAGENIGLFENGSTLTISASAVDVSDFATHSEVASVSSVLQNEIDSIPEQVNADWDAVSGKAEILNKPEESTLIAGDGISIGTSGNDYVISSNAHTYTAGNYISIQNDVISVNGISPQVNSDWKAVAGVQAILNKPDESTLLAGDGIAIAASGTDFVISSTVSAEPQVVTGINKIYYQGLDETFVNKINGYNIQAKVDQYGNVINTTYATKSQVNDLSNRVDAVSAAVSGQIPNIEITSPSGTLVINSSVSGNTKTYSIDVAPTASGNGFEYGTFHATNNVTYDATMDKVKGNIDVTNDGKIKLKQGQSYHITVRGAYNQTTPSDSTSPISYVEYISFDTITLNVDRSVTHSQFFELSYDLFNLATNVDYRILFTGLSGYINELYIDIHSISNSNTVTPVTGGTEYTAGYGIEILNNVISVSGIQPQVNSDWNSNSGKSQILNKPDLSVYATNNDLQVVSAAIPTVTPQVNSDWKAVSGVAQILNKPAESTLIAGDGISIAASGDDFVISSTVTGGGGSGVTYTAGDYIDITNNTISVTGVTDLVAGNAITITTSGASAIISSNGEAQVQSDWNVTDSNSKAYIKNKPSIPAAQIQSDWNQTNTNAKDYIKNKPSIPSYTGASGINVSSNIVSLDNPVGLIAGDNISITVSGTSAVISSTVTGGSSDVTMADLVSVSGTLQAEIDSISGVTGSGTQYTAGTGLALYNNQFSVKIDNNTITTNSQGQLVANSGGGSSSDNLIVITQAEITNLSNNGTDSEKINFMTNLYNAWADGAVIIASGVSGQLNSSPYVTYQNETIMLSSAVSSHMEDQEMQYSHTEYQFYFNKPYIRTDFEMDYGAYFISTPYLYIYIDSDPWMGDYVSMGFVTDSNNHDNRTFADWGQTSGRRAISNKPNFLATSPLSVTVDGTYKNYYTYSLDVTKLKKENGLVSTADSKIDFGAASVSFVSGGIYKKEVNINTPTVTADAFVQGEGYNNDFESWFWHAENVGDTYYGVIKGFVKYYNSDASRTTFEGLIDAKGNEIKYYRYRKSSSSDWSDFFPISKPIEITNDRQWESYIINFYLEPIANDRSALAVLGYVDFEQYSNDFVYKPVIYTQDPTVNIPYIAVPSAPSTGNYVLKCINGVIQWVQEVSNNNSSAGNEGTGGYSGGNNDEYQDDFG